ncbi:hypothetical protein HGRIS_006030 [Hohenbuehelia grisea]|uniref:Uncharacterized protein n=1 Tax=Hohenbuehelia grisea TaxID=104357 RepID=A0ABR3JYK0_9AGAR
MANPQPRPKTTNPSLRGLLTLPYRICNPPPAVGKVRSCGVTPIFKVRLQDVLDRKHLPPLGLKDFEEWLLYVELCPENLYFILWLAEYTNKYTQWVAASKSHLQQHADTNTRPSYRVSLPVQSSAQLAMFYAKAKQTFFTPNSPYELNLPSDVLAPFHTQHGSPHPDPAAFAGVAADVRSMLQGSLDRLVLATYNNVGNNRVMCGMLAGIIFSLIGAVPPLAVNFALHHARLLRFFALPGLWIGLTIFIAAFHGVCVGVYVFGDLRQLKKFELARPPISKPKPVSLDSRVISSPLTRPPIVKPLASLTTPVTSPSQGTGTPPLPTLVINTTPFSPDVNGVNSHPPSLVSPTSTFAPALSSPPPVHLAPGPSSIAHQPRAASMYSCASGSSSGSSLGSGSDAGSSSSSCLDDDPADAVIHISPAYYDAEPVEGPATTPVALDPHYQIPKPSYTFGTAAAELDATSSTSTDEAVFDVGTAGFIHPFDVPDDASDVTEYTYTAEHAPETFQRVAPFDFDALPALNSPAYSYRFRYRQPHQHALPYPQAYPYQADHLTRYSNHPTQSKYHYEYPNEPVRDGDPTSKGKGPMLVIERGRPVHADADDAVKGKGWLARLTPRALIGRMQTRCSARMWRIAVLEGAGMGDAQRRTGSHADIDVEKGEKNDQDGEKSPARRNSADQAMPTSPTRALVQVHAPSSPVRPGAQAQQPSRPQSASNSQQLPQTDDEIQSKGKKNARRNARVRSQFRLARAVPAFAVPLTRILSPIVVRGQWEIVVRSGLVAFLVSWVVVGVCVAIPA